MRRVARCCALLRRVGGMNTEGTETRRHGGKRKVGNRRWTLMNADRELPISRVGSFCAGGVMVRVGAVWNNLEQLVVRLSPPPARGQSPIPLASPTAGDAVRLGVLLVALGEGVNVAARIVPPPSGVVVRVCVENAQGIVALVR